MVRNGLYTPSEADFAVHPPPGVEHQAEQPPKSEPGVSAGTSHALQSELAVPAANVVPW